MKNQTELTKETIAAIIKENKPFLQERFKVKELGLFGSFLHGNQNPTSDVDILVEFEESPGLIDYLRLEKELTHLLGKQVDLVVKESLKQRLKARVLKEAVYF